MWRLLGIAACFLVDYSVHLNVITNTPGLGVEEIQGINLRDFIQLKW